ncbi:MAG: phage major capsid protein [Actinomycetota bacterium]|nr:phage major capsid protein [Actinomycetota bacterium]
MSTITFPELTETEGRLTERRKTLKGIFDEAGADLDMSKVKSIDGDSAAKVEAIRALNDEIDDLATKAEGLRAVHKAAERSHDDPGSAATETGDDRDQHGQKSFVDQFLKSDAYKDKGTTSEIDVDVKALFETATGWAPQPTRTSRLVDLATRPIELLDVIPTTTTTQSGSVSYWEETTFTNAAAETAEGTQKPEAALGTTERLAPVRKIAVLLPVTDEQLEDEPRVRGYIENRLPFMVRQRLAGQIAAGNGTAPNLRGILNVAGTQTQAKGTDPTPDAVYKAMIKVMTIGQAMPDAYVTNPLDWQDVRLLRTTDGIYIWGSPSDAGPDRIWGLRAVLVQAMTENTGVVGDFANFSELAVRKSLEVRVGLNLDDWAKNRQTFRAELRAALIWYRPSAYCLVTGI